MILQSQKMALACAWALTALVIGIPADLSWSGNIALAAFGLLPALGILLLWNEPAPTSPSR
jgi:hypothetical protein